MKYLENAVRFSIKNWMLILPLFILVALGNIISGVGSAVATFNNIWSAIGSLNDIDGPGAVFSILPKLFGVFAIGGGIVASLFKFVYLPATYGLVNKSLETGYASINDIGAVLSENFVKYVIYFLGTLVVGLVVGIGTCLILLLLALFILLLKGLGVALMILVLLPLFIVFFIFSILISMWLTAMIVDNLDVVAAAKKSIEIVRSCFWTVLGITLLINIAASIAGGILAVLNVIPLIGPIIYSAVPAAQTFVMIVFLLSLYREKTGRMNAW